MHPRTPSAHWRRWPRRYLAAPAVALLMLVPASTANAALPTIAAASVSIGFRATFDYPCPSCLLPVSGTSAGDVAGVDNGTSYEAVWPATATTSNFTGTIYYTTACAGNLPEVSNIDNASSITISNADLVYGTARSAATVTITFGASIAVGTEMVTAIENITISNGVVSIPVTPKSGGLLNLTPMTPVGACLTSTQQGYELSGPILAAEP
jgi:hypothetical protein